MNVGGTSEPQGIDFVAFVREVWRTKWAFVGVFVAVTASVFLVYMLLGRAVPANSEPASTPPHYAYFRFINHVELDPFDRSYAQILAEFLEILSRIDTLGLVSERDYFTGDFLPERRFFVRPSSDYSGRINMELKGGTEGLFEQIRAEFVESARLQFEVTKARANDELAMLKDLAANTYDKRSELIAEKMYKSVRFLSARDVQAGSFRYFEFLPVGAYPPVEVAHASSGEEASTKRSVGISVIFGLIFASLFIVVRMEARRRKALNLGAAP